MVIVQGFDFSLCLPHSVLHFVESPKAITLGQHTSLMDTTEVFCTLEGGKEVQVFVPEQKMHAARSKMGGSFLFIKVSLEADTLPNYWLVVYVEHKQGFLFPINFFKFEEHSTLVRESANED